jgi:hypothetical protein
MYHLSDKQIDYILNDIGARGVEMESLQQNLLDHVCCIIEQNLEANGDFENFYQKTIQTFYKDALWEIEEETLLLLTYKNYYTMKKVMINSGIISAFTFFAGSILKIMHWPGSSPLIILAMLASSFIFLPLFFLFKKNETTDSKNKIIIAIGSINGILFCVSMLFKIMHWPGAHALWLLTIGMMVLVFVPLFFFNGIKTEATKTNTIATTIILIIVAGFFFALTSLRSSKQIYFARMYHHLQNEELISRMEPEKKDTIQNIELSKLSNDITTLCVKLKDMIIINEIGQKEIPKDFEAKELFIQEAGLQGDFNPDENGYKLVIELKDKINTYNSLINNSVTKKSIFNILEKMIQTNLSQQSNYNMLDALSQIQIFVLENEQ